MPNRFVHTELSTPDVAGAKAFYAKVFDWKLEDTPMGDASYTMISSGGAGIGGIQPKLGDAATAWLPYVEVANVPKTIAKARAAGATIVVEFQPIGEMGAIGVFVDPTGAPLGVWAPANKAEAKAAKKAAKAEKKARKAAKKAEKAQKAEAPAVKPPKKTKKTAKAAPAKKAEKPKKAKAPAAKKPKGAKAAKKPKKA